MPIQDLNGFAWDTDRYPSGSRPGPYCMTVHGHVWQYGPEGWRCLTSPSLEQYARQRSAPIRHSPLDAYVDWPTQLARRTLDTIRTIEREWDGAAYGVAL